MPAYADLTDAEKEAAEATAATHRARRLGFGSPAALMPRPVPPAELERELGCCQRELRGLQRHIDHLKRQLGYAEPPQPPICQAATSCAGCAAAGQCGQLPGA